MNKSGKVLRKPISGEPVIYGIQKGKLTKALNKAPQPYSKAEAEALKASISLSQNESAQKEKKQKSKQIFFEVRTKEVEKDKNGKPVTRKVRIGNKKVKGKTVRVYKEVPQYKIKIQSKPPSKNQEWRQVIYQGAKRLGSVHPYFQKRDEYERITADMLNRNQATNIKGISARTVKAFQLESNLHGKTLAQALKTFRPDVSERWLKANKINDIVSYGTATITTKSGETFKLNFNEHEKKLSHLPTSLGRSLRMGLAKMGKTFTAPILLQKISEKISKKFKGKEHTSKAKNEKYSFTHLITDTGNRNIIEKPLDHVTNISIDMKMEFLKDDLPVKPKRKGTSKKSASKRGTKK